MIKHKKWIGKIFRLKNISISRYGKLRLDKNEKIDSFKKNFGNIRKICIKTKFGKMSQNASFRVSLPEKRLLWHPPQKPFRCGVFVWRKR